MKKSILMVMAVISLFSCNAQENKSDYVILSGTIQNSNEDIVKIQNYKRDFNKQIEIDESGNYSDTLYIDRPGFYSYQIGKSYASLFLKKGDNIHLANDADDFFKSRKVTGKGAKLNNYYIQRSNLKGELVGDAKEFFVVPIEDFIAKIEKNKGLMMAHLEKANLESEDYEIQKKMIEHDYLLTRYNYDKFNHYHTNAHPKLPEGYYNPIININLDDDDSFHYDRSYRLLVIENWRLTSKEAEKNDPNYTKAGFVKEKIKDIKSVSIREQIASMLFREVSAKNKDYQKVYDDILPLFETKYNIDRLNKRLASAKSTQPEMKSMDFNYENFAGGKTSLKDLKGKILYVEIWATWCGPCIKEMPALTQLIKDYKGKNIEFVSISVDSEKAYDKWRAMVPEKNVGGVQLLADKSLKSDFMKFFNVGLIPRSILIDADGKIITAKAPRPSAPNTREVLDTLLNTKKL